MGYGNPLHGLDSNGDRPEREPLKLPDDLAEELGDALMDVLGEAILGPQYEQIKRAHGVARRLQTDDRALVEKQLDELIGMVDNPDGAAVSQEMRMAMTAVGMAAKAGPTGDIRPGLLLAAAVERLATLSRECNAEARTASVAKATPTGTDPARPVVRS